MLDTSTPGGGKGRTCFRLFRLETTGYLSLHRQDYGWSHCNSRKHPHWASQNVKLMSDLCNIRLTLISSNLISVLVDNLKDPKLEGLKR